MRTAPSVLSKAGKVGTLAMFRECAEESRHGQLRGHTRPGDNSGGPYIFYKNSNDGRCHATGVGRSLMKRQSVTKTYERSQVLRSWRFVSRNEFGSLLGCSASDHLGKKTGLSPIPNVQDKRGT